MWQSKCQSTTPSSSELVDSSAVWKTVWEIIFPKSHNHTMKQFGNHDSTKPRRAQRAQESPGEPRRAQESPGEPRRAQESPGEPRRAQESPGVPRSASYKRAICAMVRMTCSTVRMAIFSTKKNLTLPFVPRCACSVLRMVIFHLNRV